MLYVSGNRKKRRRVDFLFNMLNEVQKMFKMRKNKIYILFNLKNLKHLVRGASTRREKNRKILYLEKVSKNWKTRRKKPPNKLAEVKLISLSIKEYHMKKKNMKEREQMLRKEERSLKQVLKRKLSDVSDVMKKISLRREVMRQEYRNSLDKNDYLMALGVPEVDIVCENLRCTSTESERRSLNCSILPTEEVRMSHKHGYKVGNEEITEKLLWERLRWSLYFAFAVRRGELEAENYSSVILGVQMEGSWTRQSYLIDFKSDEEIIRSDCCRSVYCSNEKLGYKKETHVKVSNSVDEGKLKSIVSIYLIVMLVEMFDILYKVRAKMFVDDVRSCYSYVGTPPGMEVVLVWLAWEKEVVIVRKGKSR
jgi:hypothetical protein